MRKALFRLAAVAVAFFATVACRNRGSTLITRTRERGICDERDPDPAA
jgi:hypothetical protein